MATAPAPAALAERFRRFAMVECHGSSRLYERLAEAVAADADLLSLAASAPVGQPAPNLFFAAVHFLLREDGAAAPAARFYPSLTDDPAAPEAAVPAFRAFCLARADAVRALLATRRVQTNEVGRCAFLLPALGLAARLAGERALGLIEIGASAGLNLLWDRYRYRYPRGADTQTWGDPRAPVQLVCAARGPIAPPLPARPPAVGSRVGVDLHAVDAGDPDEARWLEALVWPEHQERLAALRGAIALARRDPPRLVSGDGVALLPELLAATPPDVAPCVIHTHTLNQFAEDGRQRFAAVLDEHGRGRELYRVGVEWLGTPHPVLELTAWRGGAATRRALAECDAHGRWVTWQEARPTGA